jgi:general nucleoside transport system permease protein
MAQKSWRPILFRLEARQTPSRTMFWLSPLVAVALALVASAIIFALLGKPPVAALRIMVVDPLVGLNNLAELALKATPLLLCAIGIAIGCRANVWNIGAEGQLTLGGICGSWVALNFGGAGHVWALPLMLLAGIAGGVLWAAIPAFLRTRFNAHEILTTLMLTYVALHLLGYLVRGPWRDPAGFNFPQSKTFADDVLMPIILPATRLHLGALVALLVVPAAAFLMRRTFAGYRIRVVGLAPGAARYAGFSQKRVVWLCLLLSGGLAGFAGICEVAGPLGQLQPTISPGYGFAAIIVAYLGRLDPWGILAASLLMALIYIGGDALQVSLQMPTAMSGVIQGLVLFFLLGMDLFIGFQFRFGRRSPKPVGQLADA